MDDRIFNYFCKITTSKLDNLSAMIQKGVEQPQILDYITRLKDGIEYAMNHGENA